MPFEHARRAARERPQPHRVVPAGRGERLAVGRDGETDDRAPYALPGRPPACRAPGCQMAMRASSPLVAMRPSRRKATAFTAPSWNLSTFSAAPEASDQMIAVVSKLPETSRCPSGETASARTGPPWPRNWACAGATAQAQSQKSDNSSSIASSRALCKARTRACNLQGCRRAGAHGDQRTDPAADTSSPPSSAARPAKRGSREQLEERLQGRAEVVALAHQQIEVLDAERHEAERLPPSPPRAWRCRNRRGPSGWPGRYRGRSAPRGAV